MQSILQLQGDTSSCLTPLFLVHAISGLALPYLSLGSLSKGDERLVYGISSPFYERRSYILPLSLDALAEDYVNLIRDEVQPHGPYLLGGWSMGGMIATRMAALLERQGEEVLHVILIDSANPAEIPEFVDNYEHRILTALTFNFLAKRLILGGIEDLSVMNELGSGSGSSRRSSIYDGERDADELEANELESLDSSEEEGDKEENEFSEVTLVEWLPRMRKHISNGLLLIASENGQEDSLAIVSTPPVTLIKCGILDKLPAPLSDSRKMAIEELFNHPSSGWNKFPHMRIMKLPRAAHDDVLDFQHAGELTSMMEAILNGLRC